MLLYNLSTESKIDSVIGFEIMAFLVWFSTSEKTTFYALKHCFLISVENVTLVTESQPGLEWRQRIEGGVYSLSISDVTLSGDNPLYSFKTARAWVKISIQQSSQAVWNGEKAKQRGWS